MDFLIHHDGKFYPETPQRIVRFLQENYGHVFSTYQAKLKTLFIERETGIPRSVVEESHDGKARKTDVSNTPEIVELSSDFKRSATFLHGLSGIGYSFSGASEKMLRSKPKI